jgi:mannan endo-1,4-beta-mannosidase
MKKLLTFALLFTLGGSMFAQNLPTDKNATKKTKALYANLKAISGKGVLFGHQDDLAYGIGWKAEKGRSDVKEVSGSYPALYGWEISRLGQEHSIDSVNFEKMIGWIKEAYRRGGVNTISWHMDNPATGGNSWDNTPAVSTIIPGGAKHEFYKQRLDAFADFLNDLKVGFFGTKIPIIFRPFHEHTGSWFWWGKGNCTADEYKALWRFTVTYLRDEKNIHQLLYSYSTDQFDSETQYLEFYPGDEYVDIIAFDDYHSVNNLAERDKLIYRLKTVVELAASKGKVAAFSETGAETIPVNDWFSNNLLGGIMADELGKRIAYVMVWRNGRTDHYYAPYPGHPSVPDFVKFRNDPYTIFEDDLPNIYKMPR